MKNPLLFSALFATLFFTSATYAQETVIADAPESTLTSVQPRNDQKQPFPAGAAFFIEDMEEDLDGFLRAEIVKKQIPIKIVLSEDAADFIITGTAIADQEKKSWHEGWLSAAKDQNVGNISVIHRETDTFVWASEAGDRSLWWGSLTRGGVRKVADRLANNLKKAVK